MIMVTVEVSDPTWKRLMREKDPGDTMDDVIVRALDSMEAAHESPTEGSQ